MTELIALLIGYSIGCVLPAYFIGRAHGIDPREAGTGNAGTTNTYALLGLWPALAVAAYDVPKGVVALIIAQRVLGLTEPWAFAAGAATVIGHRFPFYLRLRGAQGVGATTGLVLYALAVAVSRGWVSLADLALFAVAVAALGLVFRNGAVTAVVVLPPLAGLVWWRSPDRVLTGYFALGAGYVAAINLLRLRDRRLLQPHVPARRERAHAPER
jgi:glycerol-3-phosphate acyltransferase PlsY